MSEEQNNKQEEQKIKRGKNFDVFISYRRSDGTVKARALDLAFGIDDCRTFLDFKSLGTGAFDKRLENAVLDAPIFIMVLTDDYFKRCVKGGETSDGKTVFEPDEDDWVRKEIELALANGKKIIPINYDKVLDNIPDYLDEDLKKGLGVHQFVNLYGDNTFDDAVKGIFDREIRPFIGATPKPENKVKVRVRADADCELIDNDEVIATIQQGKTAQLFFERGEYELIARSIEFSDIENVIERTFDDVSFSYFVKTELAYRVQQRRIEIEAKTNEKLRREAEIAADIRLQNLLEKQRREAEQAPLEEMKRSEKNNEPRDKSDGLGVKKIIAIICAVISFVLILLVCFNACENSGGATETTTETAPEEYYVVETPAEEVELPAGYPENEDRYCTETEAVIGIHTEEVVEEPFDWY